MSVTDVEAGESSPPEVAQNRPAGQRVVGDALHWRKV